MLWDDSDDEDIDEWAMKRLPENYTPPRMPENWANGTHPLARSIIESGGDLLDEWKKYCETDYIVRQCPQARLEQALADAFLQMMETLSFDSKPAPSTNTVHANSTPTWRKSDSTTKRGTAKSGVIPQTTSHKTAPQYVPCFQNLVSEHHFPRL